MTEMEKVFQVTPESLKEWTQNKYNFCGLETWVLRGEGGLGSWGAGPGVDFLQTFVDFHTDVIHSRRTCKFPPGFWWTSFEFWNCFPILTLQLFCRFDFWICFCCESYCLEKSVRFFVFYSCCEILCEGMLKRLRLRLCRHEVALSLVVDLCRCTCQSSRWIAFLSPVVVQYKEDRKIGKVHTENINSYPRVLPWFVSSYSVYAWDSCFTRSVLVFRRIDWQIHHRWGPSTSYLGITSYGSSAFQDVLTFCLGRIYLWICGVEQHMLFEVRALTSLCY